MGFKQREKKRKAKAAQTVARRDARKTGTSSGKWWLTLVKKTTCCATCGGVLREGAEMVYRARPCEALCKACAEKDPGARMARPSVRWERSRLADRRSN